MSSPSATRASLLLRLRDPSEALAWREFVELYAPLVHAYGRHRGLQDADAADLAQEVLRCTVRGLPSFEYDPARGSFRGWLYTVARRELGKLVDARTPAGTGDTAVGRLLERHPAPGSDEDQAEWDREHRWHLFHWAAQRVKSEFRERSWNAFWRTAVDGQPVEIVAQELGLSNGAVYIARSRITARIRETILTVEGD